MSDDLILTDDEKQSLAEAQPQLTKNQRAMILARRAAQAFIEQTPPFVVTESNLNLICDWLIKNGLPPETDNFILAFTALSTAHLLEDAPEVPEAPTLKVPALTLADIEKMSGDEYRKRMLGEKGFPELVNALEAAAKPRPRIQAGGHGGIGLAQRVNR
jgi:hypothetical protein